MLREEFKTESTILTDALLDGSLFPRSTLKQNTFLVFTYFNCSLNISENRFNLAHCFN